MELFICKGGCGIDVSRCFKEELVWAIVKQFQCTIATKLSMQRSYTSYPNNFSYLNDFENEKAHRGQITEGLLYKVIRYITCVDYPL